MRIEDRLARQDNEDILIIGDLIERTMKTDFGKLLIALLENFKALELQNSRSGLGGTSDKVLGRIEAYEAIHRDLEAFVERKKEIQRPVEVDRSESPEAIEQTTVLRGGEI